ncbi:MAG: type II toxin-antitoxin system RelE/ParE family toxin [Mariprofundaceae bacterium]|nr:type II toxin-antitoxin system RelE/ParE family toxin [Mariprofundaceae bacterium]
MTYTYSQKAEHDLVEIYIEGASRFGEKQADEYHGEIEEMLELLSGNPRMARERLEISPPVRIHPFRSHLIVYIVDDNNDIFIVRLRHVHEDWQGKP